MCFRPLNSIRLWRQILEPATFTQIPILCRLHKLAGTEEFQTPQQIKTSEEWIVNHRSKVVFNDRYEKFIGFSRFYELSLLLDFLGTISIPIMLHS